jgi:oxygen-independent coproporphyrinogen-3 oxidase
LHELKKAYQYDLLTQHTDYLNTLVEKKVATLEAGILKLTQKGKLLADKISSDLFVI